MMRKCFVAFDSKVFLSQEGKGRTILGLRKKQIIFSQGDAADSVFYVLEGRVKLTVVSRQGKEAIVAILKHGDFFGEACLDGQTTRTATAMALEHCRVLLIQKPCMLEALRREPAFAEMFMAHLLSRNVRIEADLVDQLFNTSERRLARALLLLAHAGKEGEREKIPKISQETLAEMVGTTRPRVSFFMNKFRKLGFIEYNEGLRVHSSLLNTILRD